MAHLVRIGNSQGIRIPKPLIQQAKLEGKELDIQVVNQGILVSPSKQPRDGWEKSITSALANSNTEEVDTEWLDADLVSDNDVVW